jgi:hypothetical protein
MITANKLKLLTTMNAAMLDGLLSPSRRSPNLSYAQFQGITNGQEFCYRVEDADGGQGKVFLRYDSAVDKISATLA